jgi:hypothetical protein
MIFCRANQDKLFDFWRKFSMEITNVVKLAKNIKKLQESDKFSFFRKEIYVT